MVKKQDESGFRNSITLEICRNVNEDENYNYLEDYELQLVMAEQVLNILAEQEKTVYIHDIYLPVGNGSEEQPVNVILAGEEWYRTLQSGNYPTVAERKRSGGMAIINENARKYVEVIDGQEVIKINGENYMVVGMYENYQIMDTKVEIGIYYCPEQQNDIVCRMLAEAFHYAFARQICIGSNVEDVKAEAEQLKTELETLGDYSIGMLEYTSDTGTGTFYAKIRGIILGVLFLISLINCRQIVELWIIRKKKDLVILKTFGMSNAHIMKCLLSELLLMLSSTMLVVLLLDILYNILIQNQSVDWRILLRNSGMLIVAFLVVAGVTILPVTQYVRKVMPAQGIRGE